MQCGVGDSDAAHLHGFESRHRCNCAGAAHLKLHILQQGDFFLGGKFVSNGPARLTGTKTQLLLQLDCIDLKHHTVNFVGQLATAAANVGVIV